LTAHNQLRIVDLGGLRSLHPLLSSQDIECCTAAVAALRNLSIYKGNEIAIIRERLLPDLCRLLKSSPHPDIQCHAAGTIRNIATEDQKDEILKEGCVEALVDILLEPNTKDTVSAEVSAALAVLASSEKCQERMASLRDGQFIQCVLEMCVSAQNAELRYNCVGIVGHLALDVGLHGSLLECKPSLLDIIRKCIETGNVSHIHIGIWSLSHLSEGGF
jgi:vacuolar protein 8